MRVDDPYPFASGNILVNDVVRQRGFTYPGLAYDIGVQDAFAIRQPYLNRSTRMGIDADYRAFELLAGSFGHGDVAAMQPLDVARLEFLVRQVPQTCDFVRG